jgi:hypothetical protein
MRMATIRVARAFTLTLDPKPLGESKDEAGRPVTIYQGEPDKLTFMPGEHEVPDDVAAHWFVQAHLEGAVQDNPQFAPYQQGAALAAQWARQGAQMGVQQTIGQPPETAIPDVALPMEERKQAAEDYAARQQKEVPEVASRSGTVPEGSHYFAGKAQEDKPLPGHEPQAPGVSFLGSAPTPNAPPKRKG